MSGDAWMWFTLFFFVLAFVLSMILRPRPTREQMLRSQARKVSMGLPMTLPILDAQAFQEGGVYEIDELPDNGAPRKLSNEGNPRRLL